MRGRPSRCAGPALRSAALGLEAVVWTDQKKSSPTPRAGGRSRRCCRAAPQRLRATRRGDRRSSSQRPPATSGRCLCWSAGQPPAVRATRPRAPAHACSLRCKAQVGAGSRPNERDGFGGTPLAAAAANGARRLAPRRCALQAHARGPRAAGHLRCVEWLLAAGADPAALDESAPRPRARGCSGLQVPQRVLMAARRSGGSSAAQLAARKGHMAVSRLLESCGGSGGQGGERVSGRRGSGQGGSSLTHD